MKLQVLFVLLLVSALLVSGSSQAQDISNRPLLSRDEESGADPVASSPLALSGKVLVEGGADIMKDTVVVMDCGFGDRARTNVDPQGRFTLMLDDRESAKDVAWGHVRASSTTGCTLRAEAPGYRSSTLDVRGHETGVVEIGVITMVPVVTGPGSGGAIVSVASLAAPDSAKKEFERGQGQAKKGKWAAACDQFRKAIRVYPKYAIAWLELGRAQLHQNDLLGAEQSFQQAASRDSKLLPAYIELARLQSSQGQWKALAMTTASMVELAPESSASFWFLDSAANYNTQNLQRAQSSAERGLRLDQAHQVPQLEYLYGLIMGTRQNYSSAVEHIKTYLRLNPHANDSHEAQTRLSEFERLAAVQTREAPAQSAQTTH